MKRGLRFGLSAGAVTALVLACAVNEVQPFIAGQYIASLDCVTPGEVIDVLNGIATDASCDATCIVPPYEAGVYVTGACAPFPPGDLVNPDDPLCKKAIAAIHRSDLCLEGGPSNPAVDAGVDATGEHDASGHDAKASHDARRD